MTAAVTIQLGKELGEVTRSITDVFTTRDYIGNLRRQYVEHVLGFYSKEILNDFNQVYTYRKFVYTPSFEYTPYDTPLSDIQDVRDDLVHIMNNMDAYNHVIAVFKSDLKNCGNAQVAMMIRNTLDSIRGKSRAFRDSAEIMDRHLGHFLTTADLVRSLMSYGRLSGMIDFYLFEEGK